MKVFTYTLTTGNHITINAVDCVSRVSIAAYGGTVSVQGTGTFQSLSSVAVTLAAGEPLTISTPSPTTFIEGVTITAQSGAARLVISMP